MAATWALPGRSAAQQRRYDAELRRLAERGDVVQAFRIIEQLEPQSHTDLITLTEIPAPPFKEERRARAYANMLRAAGADSVWIDSEGNVLALRRGRAGRRKVALAGHLDTVFPEGTEVTVKLRGDTLYAPGIGDDTRGLIVVLTVLRARGPGIDAFIAVDGGSPDRIVHQGIGSHRYGVTFTGPGGHSWGAFGLANPHHALGRAILHFVETADPYTRQGPRTSYNVGVINGGTSVNAIPFESSMEVDMRSVSPERLAGVDSLFQQAMRRALAEQNALRRQGPLLTLEVKLLGDRPSGTLDPSTPLVQRGQASARYFGLTPQLENGSTDANIPIARGLPAITIGRGGVGGGVHAPGEWWMNKGGDIAIKSALLILLAEAGVALTP